ncbi:MAG: sortase, partial [Acidimicrobiales bacterium]
AGSASATDPVGRVVGVLRRRRWLRRSLSVTSVAVMLIAIGMIGYPFYTNLYASRVQARLDRELSSEQLRQDYEQCRRAGANTAECAIQDGDSLTRIVIPDIDVSVVVVEGTSASALRAGAGHYRSTPLPCEHGNVGIAGHRTTYGRPFNQLDLLEVGDRITLEIPIGSCTYEVIDRPFVVSPHETRVLEPSSEDILTLTTCHPKGSARQRLIVQARLVSSDIPQPA